MKILWIVIFSSVLVWSVIHPADYVTWGLEAFPAIIALVLMAITFNRFRLTSLLYILILAHSIVLMVGAHYTYAEVPLFDWLQQLTAGSRNNYDKLGHFMQGLVPAILAREILIRHAVVNGRRWLNFIVVSICLAISALYELFEWLVAEISHEAADAFLGSQGYAWDTQSDMLMALIGAITAVTLLHRLHDRQLRAFTH
jgi:putative membrane protein